MTSSVSCFVRKTTEKIGTLHGSPELKETFESKDDDQAHEEEVNAVTCHLEEDAEEKEISQLPEEDRLQELRAGTAEAM